MSVTLGHSHAGTPGDHGPDLAVASAASPAHWGSGPVAEAVRGQRGVLAAAFGASLVMNLLVLTPTLYMLQLYERVLYSMNVLTLLAVSVLAALLLALMGLADRWRGRTLAVAVGAFVRSLQRPLFQAGWRDALTTRCSVGTAAQRDLAAVRQSLSGPGLAAVLDLPWTPVYVAASWLLHPLLGLSVLVFLLLQALLAWKGHGLSVPAARAVQEAVQHEMSDTRRQFQQAETVSALGMAMPLRSRWLQRHRQALASAMLAQSLSNRLAAVSKTLRYLQQSAALGIGGWLVAHGELSAGAMIAGTVLTTRALAPVDAVVSAWKDLIAGTQALRRIDRTLRQRGMPEDEIVQHDSAPGEPLRLDEVSAWVPGSRRTILRGINLVLPPGQVCALVGPSGAGKSTLARVIAGSWTSGIGGVWRPPLGTPQAYLPQEVVLFPASVADNIARLGQPDAAAVVAAARRVGLHEQILRLPKGYDTVVGDGGHPLSGGFCQRLGLARALYGEPRLVILDEPSAHLDENGERALEVLLQDLRSTGCHVVMVTHARRLLRIADRVVYLDQGAIVADQPTP